MPTPARLSASRGRSRSVHRVSPLVIDMSVMMEVFPGHRRSVARTSIRWNVWPAPDATRDSAFSECRRIQISALGSGRAPLAEMVTAVWKVGLSVRRIFIAWSGGRSRISQKSPSCRKATQPHGSRYKSCYRPGHESSNHRNGDDIRGAGGASLRTKRQRQWPWHKLCRHRRDHWR